MILSGSAQGAIAILGIECSTFVGINKGSSKRSELLPWGDWEVDSVSDANEATSRTMLSNPNKVLINHIYPYIIYTPFKPLWSPVLPVEQAPQQLN